MPGIKRTAGVRCATSTSLVSLDRNSLVAALEDHPHVKAYMIKIASRRRVRVALLDPSAPRPAKKLTDQQMMDEEDSATKYFIANENMQKQDVLTSQFHDLRSRSTIDASTRTIKS